MSYSSLFTSENSKKFHFKMLGGNDNDKYLGYVVNEHGKHLPDSRVDDILKLAAPTTVKRVRGLLGKTN